MDSSCNTFEYTLIYVAENAWRLLAMQDRNPISPSYGCFHYAYWRDKSSEFADSRFQEAGATLGLLCLAEFDHFRETGALPSKEFLYEGFSAGLLFLSRQQYPEGCYDEWYKGERGFAATAFTTAAYGLTAYFLRDELADAERKLLDSTLSRAADWLTKRDDVVKINHEAVAAAALALTWKVTDNQRYRTAAKEKLDVTLSHQNHEGWFTELNGMDLGYSTLVLDHLMIYRYITNDDAVLPPMFRLMDFIFPHLHPDLTISPEGGTCRNPYVGSIGFNLLACHDERASTIVKRLRQDKHSRAGIVGYIADDLRFTRCAYLPLVSFLLQDACSSSDESGLRLENLYPAGWTYHRNACLFAYHNANLHVYVAAAGGGVLRGFFKDRLAFEDLGIDIVRRDETMTSKVYDAKRRVTLSENSIEVDLPMSRVHFFFPGIVSRLVLRFGSITPTSSKLLRSMIDLYRTRKNTAINQSTTSVGYERQDLHLVRKVGVFDDTVTVTDELSSRNFPLSSSELRMNFLVDGKPREVLSEDFFDKSKLRIVKRLRPDETKTKAAVDVHPA